MLCYQYKELKGCGVNRGPCIWRIVTMEHWLILVYLHSINTDAGILMLRCGYC